MTAANIPTENKAIVRSLTTLFLSLAKSLEAFPKLNLVMLTTSQDLSLYPKEAFEPLASNIISDYGVSQSLLYYDDFIAYDIA
jgi:hypothetical protein